MSTPIYLKQSMDKCQRPFDGKQRWTSLSAFVAMVNFKMAEDKTVYKTKYLEVNV